MGNFLNQHVDIGQIKCETNRNSKFIKQTAWWTEEIKQPINIKRVKWQRYLSNKM